MQVVLASTSPRRRELLALLGFPFQTVSPLCQEIYLPHLSPTEQTRQLALAKAYSIVSHFPEDVVLGSDTVVEIDGRLFGKPADRPEAEYMLRHLSGRCHQVHTGVSVVQQGKSCSVDFVETAEVCFRTFDDETLRTYLDTEESMGKAGAYSIQGEGAQLIERIEGDYLTIVGLPLWRTAKILEQFGINLPTPIEKIYALKPYANWKDFA